MPPLEYYECLTKISTMGISAEGELREYEEMTPTKWKQTAKDIALGSLGAGIGFGAGKLLTDSITNKMLQDKQGWKMLKKYGPTVAAVAASGVAIGRQYRSLQNKQNREHAEALHQAKLQKQIAAIRHRNRGPAVHRTYSE